MRLCIPRDNNNPEDLMDHDVVKHAAQNTEAECSYPLGQDSTEAAGTCRAPAVEAVEENEGFRWSGRCSVHKDL